MRCDSRNEKMTRLTQGKYRKMLPFLFAMGILISCQQGENVESRTETVAETEETVETTEVEETEKRNQEDQEEAAGEQKEETTTINKQSSSAVLPDVLIEDAFYQEDYFKNEFDEDVLYSYNIPRLTIDTVEAEKINQEMEERYLSVAEDALDQIKSSQFDDNTVLIIGYDKYRYEENGEDILAIIVYDFAYNTGRNYTGYYYDIKDEKVLDTTSYLKKLNISEEEYLLAAKDAVVADLKAGYSQYEGEDWFNEELESLADEVEIGNTAPYAGEYYWSSTDEYGMGYETDEAYESELAAYIRAFTPAGAGREYFSFSLGIQVDGEWQLRGQDVEWDWQKFDTMAYLLEEVEMGNLPQFEGMTLLDEEMNVEIAGLICAAYSFGTNHEENFVREYHVYVSDTGAIFEYDVVNDEYIALNEIAAEALA